MAIAPPARTGPVPNLFDFLGVTHACEKLGALVQGGLSHLGLIFPGLEPGPPLLPITDPANLASDNPAVAAAAAAKAEEDQAEQKIKAIRYLATLGCAGCYPGIEEALLAALDDCTERVRYEAAKALRDLSGDPCASCKEKACCSEKVRKRLDAVATKTKDDGCYVETSERVRRMARVALNNCGAPAPSTEPQTPEEGPSDSDLEAGNVARRGNRPHQARPDAALTNPAQLAASEPASTTTSTTASTIDSNTIQDSAVQPASHSEVVGLRTADRGMLLALVYQQPIFAGDLKAEVDAQLARLRGTVSPPQFAELRQQIEQRVLQRAIDRKLLVHAARSQMPGRELVDLEQALKAVNAPATEREAAVAKLWLQRHVKIDTNVFMAEIEQVYRAAPQNYVRPEQVRWQQVTAPVASFAQPQLALATLTAVRQQRLGLPAPPVDQTVLTQLRVVPHDWTARDKMPNEGLAELAYGLQPGQASQILEGEDGFYFVEVLERRPAQAGELADVADKIREEILNRRRLEAEQQYLRTLRAQGGVWTSTEQPQAQPQTQTPNQQAGQQAVPPGIPALPPDPQVAPAITPAMVTPGHSVLPVPSGNSARLPSPAGGSILR